MKDFVFCTIFISSVLFEFKRYRTSLEDVTSIIQENVIRVFNIISLLTYHRLKVHDVAEAIRISYVCINY